jgi:hypothetical protein
MPTKERALLALALVLQPTIAAAQTINGRVVDDSARAVVGATVELLNPEGERLDDTRTDDGGAFTFGTSFGVYLFRVLRAGRTPSITPAVQVTRDAMIVHLTVTVRAASSDDPHVLAPVVVEGEALVHLAEFYRRRAIGFGDFVTRDEFERWHPHEVTDIVRRMPSFLVLPNPTYGRRLASGMIDTREYRIEVAGRSRGPSIPECPVELFLDGRYLGNTGSLDVETVLSVQVIEAVETYSRPAQMPPEFNRMGSGCGVIAFWTRQGTATEGMAGAELALRYGGAIGRGSIRETRVGAHVVAHVWGPIDFYPAFHIGVETPLLAEGSEFSGWQAQLAARVRPTSHLPLFLGTGVLATKRTDLFEALASGAPGIEVGHTLFAGLTARVGRAAPFAEVHLVDLLGFDEVRGQLYVGLGLRLGRGRE